MSHVNNGKSKLCPQGLQKVSEQLAAASSSHAGLELSKSVPQTVLNNE